MPEINAVKLQRLIAHFNDEGQATVTAVANVLKSKPENVNYARPYVEAAATDIGDPTLLTVFDASVAKLKEPAPATTTEPPAEPGKEVVSVPEKSLLGNGAAAAPTAPAPVVKTDAVVTPAGVAKSSSQAPGGTDNLTYTYTDANGIAHKLVEVHRKGNRVVLGNAPTDKTVNVVLAGKTVTLNITDLEKRPGGEMVEIDGRGYRAATLLVIAESAEP